MLDVSLITSLKSNLCTAITTQNTTQNNCIISHAKNMTALQLNVFLTGIHQLLVTNKGGSDFSSERKKKRKKKKTANSSVSSNTLIQSLIASNLNLEKTASSKMLVST
jgi:hypothetical protein